MKSSHIWEQPINCSSTQFRQQICCYTGILESVLCQLVSTEPSVLLLDYKNTILCVRATCMYAVDM